MSTKHGHALVVGGTGMLAGVSLELARRGWCTSVVGRRESRLRDLERRAVQLDGRIHPLIIDYRSTDAFVAAVKGAESVHGPIEVAVVWVHSVAPEAPGVLADALSSGDHSVRYLHVLGSASADPAAPEPGRVARFDALPGIAYEEVVLGFIVDGPRSRWLTNDEISAGVLAAVDSPASRTVVGVVEPWDRRP